MKHLHPDHHHHDLVATPEYLALHDDAVDFVESFAGEGFIEKIRPIPRQDLFVENIIALRHRNDPAEMHLAVEVLEKGTPEETVEFFCEQSIFDVTATPPKPLGRVGKALRPITSKLPLAWGYAKLGLKEGLLVHPVVIPSIAALGVPLHAVEVASAMYLCREGAQVAFEFLERHFDPLALTRIKKEKDVYKWPILPLLERTSKVTDGGSTNQEDRRLDLAFRSQKLMEQTLHLTPPALRLAMHNLPERQVVRFCDAALRAFQKNDPSIDPTVVLDGEQRFRAHRITEHIAHEMGIQPSPLNRGLAHVFDGVETTRDYMAEKAHKTLRKIPVTQSLGRRIDAIFGIEEDSTLPPRGGPGPR